MQPLSTAEVARLVKVHTVSLERWLAANHSLQPKTLRSGKRVVRLWTLKDVEKLKKYKAGRRRGRKPKVKK